MDEKTKQITQRNLIHFIIAVFRLHKIEVDMDFVIELSDLVHQCFDNDMMFDSWFRGLDVMN